MPTLPLTFPAGSYPSAVTMTALTRTDTGDAVSFTAAFTGASATWSNTWTAPATDLTYHWYATATIGGVATPLDGVWEDVSADVSGIVGTYGSTVADVRLWLGRIQANSLSNTDGTSQNDPTPDADSFAQALEFAGSEIEDNLVGLGIVVTTVPAADTAAGKTLKRLETWLAVINLWQKRPHADQSNKSFRELMERVQAVFKRWWDEPSTIPAGFATDADGYNPNVLTAPVAIYPTVDKDGREITPSNQRVGPYWDANRQRYWPGRW